MEKVRPRSGGSEQNRTERASERCSIIFLSLSLAFFDWFLENRVPYPEMGVQETEHTIEEINVSCKKIDPLFMHYETLLVSSLGAELNTGLVLRTSPDLLPEISLPWWSAYPSATSYFSPLFPSHASWFCLYGLVLARDELLFGSKAKHERLHLIFAKECNRTWKVNVGDIFQSLGAGVVTSLRTGEWTRSLDEEQGGRATGQGQDQCYIG